MDIQKHARDIVYRQDGIAKSADFVAEGISAVKVVALCDEGLLKRVSHGYYSLAEHNIISRRSRSEERRVGKECRSRWSPYH